MARLANTKNEYRQLFARTGNQCAFPECLHPLIDDDGDYIAEVCHIEAANEDGERYNSAMDDEGRKSVDNLLVLCRRHHIKTNNVEIYAVPVLQKMKADHESIWSGRQYEIPDEVVDQIFEEQLILERQITDINEEWRKKFDLGMKLELFADPAKHINELVESLDSIKENLDHLGKFLHGLQSSIGEYLSQLGYDLEPYQNAPDIDNPFHDAFWVFMTLGRPNFLNHIDFHLKALTVLAQIQNLKARPNDAEIRAKLDELKIDLSNMAGSIGHVD